MKQHQTPTMLLLFVLCASIATATICDNPITPNEECTLLTPAIISCATYNYTIYNESGAKLQEANLTLINDTIYSLNINESTGTYVIKLCDYTTREINVGAILEDNKMIAIILGLIACATFFVLFGLKAEKEGNYWVRYASFTLASIQLALMLGAMYAFTANKDITTLLQINFYGIGIILIGLTLYTLFIQSLNVATDSDEHWEDNWQKRGKTL
jgi:hypothetical protein